MLEFILGLYAVVPFEILGLVYPVQANLVLFLQQCLESMPTDNLSCRNPHSRTPRNDSPTEMKFLSQNFKYFTMDFCLLTWSLALLYPIQIKWLSLYLSCNHCYHFSLTRKDCFCKISEGCFVYLSEQLVAF